MKEQEQIARSDAILDRREASHQQVNRYFSIRHGKRPIYEEMPDMQHTINLLVDQGDFGLQGRLDGTWEVFDMKESIEYKIKEPIDVNR